VINMCGEGLKELKLYKIGEDFLCKEVYEPVESGTTTITFSLLKKKEAETCFNQSDIAEAKKMPIWGKSQIFVNSKDFIDDLQQMLDHSTDDAFTDMETDKEQDKLLERFVKLQVKAFIRRIKQGEV
jgi:hypothetical protein